MFNTTQYYFNRYKNSTLEPENGTGLMFQAIALPDLGGTA